MRREGRQQHGMVRTSPLSSGPLLIPRPSPKLVNGLASRPNEGSSNKVPKYTGKCSNRHNLVKLLIKTGENMKSQRDGLQRGVVRTRPLESSAPPQARQRAGVTTRRGPILQVQQERHIRPVSRSKPRVKAKGAHNKVDSLSDIRLVSWRVVDAPCSKLSGFSAAGVLDYLDSRW